MKDEAINFRFTHTMYLKIALSIKCIWIGLFSWFGAIYRKRPIIGRPI